MKRHIAFAAIIVLAAVGIASVSQPSASTAIAAGPADTYVLEWDAIGVQALGAAGLAPPEGHASFGWVGIAIYDSVVAIKGGYEPFAVKEKASPGASAEAAMVAAAYRTLSRLLPAQEPTILGPAYAKSLASIQDGPGKQAGIAVGRRVADQLFVQRASNGYQQYVYGVPSPPVAGEWLLTGPAPALGQSLVGMQPFALESAHQFRPDGPPALGSQDWAREYNEVKEIGSRNSAKRTAAQTLAARFWAEAPVPQAHGSFQKFIRDKQLDIVDAARFLGMMTVTYADSMIACFDAKYHYASWRPVTAIQAGATDGNDQTIGDSGWLPLLPATPNHPEYPSAHSCVTPAGADVIAEFLGTDRIRFTIPSISGLGDRYYETSGDLAREVAEARVWGGIHFRAAIVDGTELGRKTADYVLSHYFRKVSN